MAAPSLSVARRPFHKAIKVIFQNQIKRNFRTTSKCKTGKRKLSTQGNGLVANQTASDVRAASDVNQLGKSFTSPSHNTTLVGSLADRVFRRRQNKLESIPTQTQAFSGVAQTHNPSENVRVSTRSVQLEDLQADPPNYHHGSIFREDKVMKERALFPGQTVLENNGLVDPTTMQQVYYFDTLASMKKLETRGFTREQAEVCIECLAEIINSTLSHQAKHMITKSQQEIAVQQLLSEIISVKKDMVLLQKSEFSSLRSETEKIGMDMKRIETHFQDEVVKLKGQFSLDINLERGRAVEAHAGSENKLQLLHNKIDTEIANLKTTFEIYRNDVIKFAGGTVLTCATLILGFIRLWT